MLLVSTTAFQFAELFTGQWISEDGIKYEYKVQICASWQKQIPISFLQTQFNLTDSIREDYHQGWYKYSVGSFAVLAEAREYRDQLRKNNHVFGAFVVLITDDKRSDILLNIKPVEEILAVQPTDNDTVKLPDSITETVNSSWRVQIQTSKGSSLSSEGIRLVYSIQDSVFEEVTNNDEYLYTVGNFTTYDSAATYCEYLRTTKNIKEAIVISYLNNQRISEVKRSDHIVSTKPIVQTKKPNLYTSKKKSKTNSFTQVSMQSTVRKTEHSPQREQSKEVEVQKTPEQTKEQIIRDSQIYFNENDTFVSAQPIYKPRPLLQKYDESIEDKHYWDSVHKTHEFPNLATQLIEFGQQYFSKSNSKVFTRFIDKAYRDLFVFVIILIVIFLVINLVLITLIVIISRLIKDYRSSHKKKLQMQYNEIIANFLFENDNTNDIPPFHSRFQRNIFIEELMKLSSDLSGEALDRIKLLYYNLGLDEDSMRKVKSWRWHIRAKGFKETTRMEVYRAASRIEKYLNSKNEIIRSEAGLALIQLNKQYPFEFLEKVQRSLTLWDQTNIHTLINKNKIEIPDFGRWLQMKNISVVLFAIRMIRIFEQTHNAPYILALLDNKDCNIRREAIRAIAQFGYIDAIYKLIEIYPFEKEENQLAILQAFRSIPDESTFELLIPILEGNSEHQFKMEAARALIAAGVKGRVILQGLLAHADPHTQKVIHHVFDTRI